MTITVSDIIAFIAFVVSVLAACFSWRQFRYTQRLTLESQYFSDLFKDYLVTNFPKGESDITFLNGQIKSEEGLRNAAIELRKSVRYFAYVDEPFYKQLKVLLQDLEDKLGNARNRYFDADQQITYRVEINQLLKDIYTHISKRYSI